MFQPSDHLQMISGATAPLESRIFLFQGMELYLQPNGELPTLACFPQEFRASLEGLFVGQLEGLPCLTLPCPTKLPGCLSLHRVREAFACLPEGQRFAIGRAKELLAWRNREQYCGKCGFPLQDSPNDLARVCPQCGERFYPQIAPAVITAILRDDGRILLAHNKKFRPGMYSLIAGFVEAGESAEQAVTREIREEVNLEVDEITYLGSQCWPFPNSLMLGFKAHYKSGELRVDGVEIEDAGWYTPDSHPMLPDPGSIARRILDELLH